MLIKRIDRKGNPVPMSAEEALKHAIVRACKASNTLETIYWADNRSVKVDPDGFTSRAGADGVWQAWAQGTVDIGKTIAKTGLFHKPVPHTFKVHYKLAKDEWGIPDIAIVGEPELIPIERDPSKKVGPLPVVDQNLKAVQEQKPFVKPEQRRKQEQKQ